MLDPTGLHVDEEGYHWTLRNRMACIVGYHAFMTQDKLMRLVSFNPMASKDSNPVRCFWLWLASYSWWYEEAKAGNMEGPLS